MTVWTRRQSLKAAGPVTGTIRLVERNGESFLAWARAPHACMIFNLHLVLLLEDDVSRPLTLHPLPQLGARERGKSKSLLLPLWGSGGVSDDVIEGRTS